MRVTQSGLINSTEIYVQNILKKNRENIFVTCKSGTIYKQGGQPWCKADPRNRVRRQLSAA